MIAIDLNEMRITANPEHISPRTFYSKLKELWYYNRLLPRYPFPVKVIGGEALGKDGHGRIVRSCRVVVPASYDYENPWRIDYCDGAAQFTREDEAN